ncbi:hypothetical protein LCGC14_0778990 [marine sediment metagenome]|uniref:Uncharacterized protein n=1 Tax=marine sediment metagenome TaxID=412755 RepID=A0A0F9PW95_9ZZZZ
MFYEFDLTIPANTPKSAPAELEVFLSAGIVKQVEIQIPRGCRSLVHTIAVRGIHQVWPSNPDGSHKGDDARIVFNEDYDLVDPPHGFMLRGWSPDTSYIHVVTWRFQVVVVPVSEVKQPVKKKGILSALMNKGGS